MKAQVLHGIGDLRYEDVPVPQPGPGEVLMRVRAVGICGSDVPRTFQTGAHRHPIIIGHEFAGEVEGKPYGVFPLIPCGKCKPCLMGKYEMCRHYDYLGSRRDGGFAEYVAVPERNLLPLPDGVSYEEAAMLEPMAVAVHAIRQVFPEMKAPGEKEFTIAVIGLGTIGLLLTLFLQEAGLGKILTVGNKKFQRDQVLLMGIPEENYIDTKSIDATKRINAVTEGYGVDVVFECVGRNETLSQAVEVAGPGGAVVTVGNPASDMTLTRDIYWKILRNQLRVSGTWNSSYLGRGAAGDDWHYVLDRLAAGRIRPAQFITHRLSLEDLPRGLHIMKDKTEDYAKIMIVF